ncbi:hypothetical protein AB4Z30_06215 [Paenibacillus sp. 2TAF8]|jgi:hypothetical protein|uniref:hypothetical protein n=1 Tax=Paenibacillus sp. 2TAF8 TaxID=3233020 RepID=UPI003F985C31
MLKKLIFASLITALSLPATGAFSMADHTERVKPNVPSIIDSRLTIVPESGSDEVKIMTGTYRVKQGPGANIRATPSRNGKYITSVYYPTELNIGRQSWFVDGEEWVQALGGYVLLSSLEEIG